MGRLLYHIFIAIYTLGAKIVSPFNQKAKLWLKGRENVFEDLSVAFANGQSQVIWIHCASLGEFEQGRPVTERLKLLYPSHHILITFFSPSGYEVQKNYAVASHVFYLPIDSPANAKRFLTIVKPVLILFVKYEFWNYYLQEAKSRNIPLLLVSGIFRESQPFFKWYGGFHQKMLACFTHIFTQDEASVVLLKSIGFNNVSVSGDTRFDRVLEIAERFEDIPLIKEFCAGKTVIVAGSTWTDDDEELDHYANTHPGIRFIIAPHDIGESRIKECMGLYKNAMLFSTYKAHNGKENFALTNNNTLIIDNIGMLSRLYYYATVAFVGGAFGGDGVHNVLEAAVYNKPVVYGPVFEKYAEAVELIEEGGGITVPDALELEKAFDRLLNDPLFYSKTADAAGKYVRSKTGATDMLVTYIQEKRLLIS